MDRYRLNLITVKQVASETHNHLQREVNNQKPYTHTLVITEWC